MKRFRKTLGLLRSRIIYYWKPFVFRKMIRFYKPFIHTGDLCFDIGAHLGNRIYSWRRLGAKVVAVEPQPHCIKYLQHKFGKDESVVIESIAIGAQQGTAPLHISWLTPTISTLGDEDWRHKMEEMTSFKIKWDESIEVNVLTLDDLIEKYGMPVFCKLDVEDFELQALRGLSRAIPVVSFEYFSATPNRCALCIERLNEIGSYEYNWSYGESLNFNSSKWLQSAEMLDIVKTWSPDDRSGDIYARLK